MPLQLIILKILLQYQFENHSKYKPQVHLTIIKQAQFWFISNYFFKKKKTDIIMIIKEVNSIPNSLYSIYQNKIYKKYYN